MPGRAVWLASGGRAAGGRGLSTAGYARCFPKHDVALVAGMCVCAGATLYAACLAVTAATGHTEALNLFRLPAPALASRVDSHLCSRGRRCGAAQACGARPPCRPVQHCSRWAGFQLQAQLQGCPALHLMLLCPVCAVLSWRATDPGCCVVLLLLCCVTAAVVLLLLLRYCCCCVTAVVLLLLQIACPGAHGRMAATSATP